MDVRLDMRSVSLRCSSFHDHQRLISQWSANSLGSLWSHVRSLRRYPCFHPHLQRFHMLYHSWKYRRSFLCVPHSVHRSDCQVLLFQSAHRLPVSNRRWRQRSYPRMRKFQIKLPSRCYRNLFDTLVRRSYDQRIHPDLPFQQDHDWWSFPCGTLKHYEITHHMQRSPLSLTGLRLLQ